MKRLFSLILAAVSAAASVRGQSTPPRHLAAWKAGPSEVFSFDPAQIEALRAANACRRVLGLAPFHLNARLSAAATAHSAYLVRNHLSGHEEAPDLPGSTGVSPAERLRAVGFPASRSWAEDVGASATPADAVKTLFDAPYHRLPFMAPGSTEIGIGYIDGMLTIEFSSTGQLNRFILSPADGQTGVPLSWVGHERPSPTRLHPSARFPVGYPIVLSFQTVPGAPRISVTRAELRTSNGALVPSFVNTTGDDDKLHDACFLIPERPLQPNTAFTASVELQTGDGTAFRQIWSFRTTTAPAVEFHASLEDSESRQAPFRVSISVFNHGPGAVAGFTLTAVDADGRRTARALPALGPALELTGVFSFDRRPATVELTPLYTGALPLSLPLSG